MEGEEDMVSLQKNLRGVFSEVLYPKGSSNLNMGVGCGCKMEWPMKMTVIAQIRVVRPLTLCFVCFYIESRTGDTVLQTAG